MTMKLKKNYPHESPIWINNIDINNIVVSKKETFSKQFNLQFSLVTTTLNKFDLYAYSFQRCIHIDKILIKLNAWLF